MTDPHEARNGMEPSDRSWLASLLRRQLPYIAALVLAIAGVAYTNISQQPLTGYWEFLALAVGVVCVVTQWEYFPDRDARIRLM